MNILKKYFQEVTGNIPVPPFGNDLAGLTSQTLPESAFIMLTYIVVTVDGIHHICYRVPGTATYTSYETAVSLTLANVRAKEMNRRVQFGELDQDF